MRTFEQRQQAMGAVAGQIEAAVAEHEADAHGGGVCPAERLAAIAFLAHRLGLRSDSPKSFEVLARLLEAYEESCPGCQHPQVRNPRG